MIAALFKEKNSPLLIEEVKKPAPGKGQVLIKLHAAALNHRDLWIQKEQANPSSSGIILGSDGSGVIESLGEDIEEEIIGQEVVINPSINWGKNSAVQSDAFKFLGFPDAGTFAQYVAVSRKLVVEKPQHLSFEQAATVPLSGLTAYRALFTKARIRPGEKVLVTGAGGGAALWAVKFAVAFQARVFITSGSEEKIKKCIELGATAGFNYKEKGWIEKITKEVGGFDVIIDSAGGEQFPSLLDLAMPGGRIVIFGRTAGNIPSISPRTLFWKQLSIFGTSMGTEDEFLSMLDLIHKRKIIPVIDEVFPLQNVNEAFARMENGGQFGKIVLNIPQ
ncbi:MAG: zinc-binding dehydrogenase [Cyclobacteriaceae bacterium]|nr:zinc-binding dehydrogenase [Cyclobacteriaceae bacterium]